MTDSTLAAVVRKPESEATIAALQAEGVYDATRKVRERDDDTVELPVTDPPGETAVLDVVEQVDPERRLPDLDAHLRERGWSDDEIERAPSSWAVIGSVILVSFGDEDDADRDGQDDTDRNGADDANRDGGEDADRENSDSEVSDVDREAVGEALLDLHREADTVLADEGVAGEFREPSVSVVAGEGDTETVHTEHGTRYALDLAEVMFSPGNKAERARMGEVVEPGERAFDMFAGVGYFTLPMARAGADVIATEKNPTAFQYLIENAMLNDVSDRVSAFRADCRDVAIEPRVDRAVMGYYEAHEYLDAALAALKPGGVVHLHEATPEELLWDRPVSRLRDAAEAAGREAEILDRRIVKSHSEGVRHVVVDARIE